MSSLINFLAVLMLTVSTASAAMLPAPLTVHDSTAPYSYDPSAPNGPSNWGTLPDSGTCGSGTKQSPIDFPCQAPTLLNLLQILDTPQVTTAQATFQYELKNFNWALSCVTPGTCGSTVYRGVTYKVINMHFHSESEHTINGVRYPLEAHFVHQSDDGSLLVIGVLFSDENSSGDCITSGPTTGASNSEFGKILDNISAGNSQFVIDTDAFLEGKLLERLGLGITSFCTYSGSLTTPPCSEPVTWFVAGKRETVGSTQVQAYRASTGSATHGNSRPIQTFNNRQITCYYLI